ncbi:hypothetical protein [Micromonospora lutea]|uniref:DUF916 domain-containing protein n=1 Tax=Micromonospora lutea TaxID=419825 RepID=A0ABQ4IRS5_9ACTN|nr:hypothetical protein [Micromonospora lutea]GIJ20604.1 hypothetical protein Vlu01_12280 [Micromonospora lutea]
MIRFLPRWVAVLGVMSAIVSITPVAASAEPTGATVTWAVQPADARGPDGRRWIEHTLDPGAVVTEHLAVRNFGDSPVVFALQAADGYLTDKGRFNMLTSGQESVDGGTWIMLPETVTVGAKQTKVVPFTITVPPDATPGDHPAGVAATVTSTGGTVAVQSRVGFRVMLRASGTVTATIGVEDLIVRYERSWNPFTAGDVHLTFTARNNGNVAVTGDGTVRVDEMVGSGGRNASTEVPELMPGDGRQVAARVGGVWGLGRLTTTVEVTPAVVSGDPAGAQMRPTTTTVTVWAVPWPHLVITVLIGTVILGWLTSTRRRRRHLARLLDQARAEGRAEGRTSVITAD